MIASSTNGCFTSRRGKALL